MRSIFVECTQIVRELEKDASGSGMETETLDVSEDLHISCSYRAWTDDFDHAEKTIEQALTGFGQLKGYVYRLVTILHYHLPLDFEP